MSLNEHITLSECIHTLNDAHESYATPLAKVCDDLLDMDSSGNLPWSPWVHMNTPTVGMSQGNSARNGRGANRKFNIGVYRITHVDDISENGIANRVAYYGEGRLAMRLGAIRTTFRKSHAGSYTGSAWHPCGGHMYNEEPLPNLENWYYSFFDLTAYDSAVIVKKDIARVLEYKLVHRDLPRFNDLHQVHNRDIVTGR